MVPLSLATTTPPNPTLSLSLSLSLSPPPLTLPSSSPPPLIKQHHANSLKLSAFNPTSLLTSLCTSFHSHPPSLPDLHYALTLLPLSTTPSPFFYNTLIRSLNLLHHPHRALSLFRQMLLDPSLLPDNYTYPFVLKSCGILAALQEGRQVHCLAVKGGFVEDVYVANSLIHMYARCDMIESACRVFGGMGERNLVSWNCMVDGFVKAGDLENARRVFDEMPERNVVSWNSMIAGYAKDSLVDDAVELFSQLKASGEISPDETTLMSVISMVSDLGLLCLGTRIHGYIIRNEFSLSGTLGAALIDMYSKCGNIYSALRVFEYTEDKNVGHWTSMIVGYAVHGYAEASLHLFSQMQNTGVKPNYVTFIGVLCACSRGGLVEQGIRHFNLMNTYNIEPGIQHYGCLVDLLGRSNLIREAKQLVDNMPMEPGAVIWGTLLAACRNHGDIEIGEVAAQKLIELAPDYGGGYVLLSNLYADACRWVDFGRMRRMMGERGAEKVSGLSWIEVDGKIHEFLVGDKFHPRSSEMYKLLDGIQCKLSWE